MVSSVFVVSFIIGLIVEWVAYKNSLWKYQKPAYLLFNIIFVFSFIQGGIAFLCVFGVDSINASRIIMFSLVGSVIGVLYEVCNEYGFRLFYFGSNFIRRCGKRNLILGVGVAWGGVPFISSFVYWWLYYQ